MRASLTTLKSVVNSMVAQPDDATEARSGYLDFLKLESEHFYKAELQCEQRASWLLTVAFGALAVVLNAFEGVSDGKLRPSIAPFLSLTALLLFTTISTALLAIWPISGRRGRLHGLKASPDRMPPANTEALALWSEHYLAHRRRAEVKAARITVTVLILFLAGASAFVAVLINSGVL